MYKLYAYIQSAYLHVPAIGTSEHRSLTNRGRGLISGYCPSIGRSHQQELPGIGSADVTSFAALPCIHIGHSIINLPN